MFGNKLLTRVNRCEKRHIKATYANSTPATDGRIVVAWFGSQGLYAYDVNGKFLWKVELGRIDAGAYDVPTVEWGPASSPIIWKDLVILQCDTQADSFIMALDANTGKTVWKTDRDEIPSWGTPTVVSTAKGEELVANASNFIRGYDPRTGKELWRLGKSSKITAPTPIFADDMLVVVSGRGPERPIFVMKTGARGDLTLPDGKTSSDAVIWSRTGRGSYMPTPLIYNGILYVLSNNGTFDAYNLKTGDELYRQRLPVVGSGFSASPVASDGKIYLSNEDGEIIVVAAGEKFAHVATNSMGELLMATPALSDGVMYVRSSASLFAIGKTEPSAVAPGQLIKTSLAGDPALPRSVPLLRYWLACLHLQIAARVFDLREIMRSERGSSCKLPAYSEAWEFRHRLCARNRSPTRLGSHPCHPPVPRLLGSIPLVGADKYPRQLCPLLLRHRCPQPPAILASQLRLAHSTQRSHRRSRPCF